MQSKIFFFVLTFFLIVTCSTLRNDKTMGTDAEKKTAQAPKPQDKASTETKVVAAEAETNLVTEIEFPEGKTALPEKAKKDIQELHTRARKQGPIGAVKILTWGDREYPSEEKEELSNQQIKLVEDRNDSIEAYVDELEADLRIDKISMAERPGALDDIMSGDNVRLKESFETSGIPTTAQRQEDETQQAESKASKSVIMFILKKNTK